MMTHDNDLNRFGQPAARPAGLAKIDKLLTWGAAIIVTGIVLIFVFFGR